MNILYLHGYGSKFDINSSKNKELAKIGTVHGVDIDYSLPYEYNERNITAKLVHTDIDLIIGTSMGGYYANRIGTSVGIPFVMINPVVDPRSVLEKYDQHKSVIDSYKYKALIYECGMLLLDSGDDVIPIKPTIKYFEDFFETHTFSGGSHRFEHMKESLPLIVDFYQINSITFGTQ